MNEQEVMLCADNAHELLSEMIMALLDEADIEFVVTLLMNGIVFARKVNSINNHHQDAHPTLQ